MTQQPYQTVQPSRPVRFTQPANLYQRAVNAVPASARRVNVPSGLPTFLGNRNLLFGTWGVSMLVVSYDEWHNFGILPRPARLWSTSVVYGLLAIVSVADAVVPIANALAVGFTFTLLYQLWGGSAKAPPSSSVQSVNIGGGQVVTGTNQTGIIGISNG